MKGVSAESRKNNLHAETSLIFISPRSSMTVLFFVTPNLFRDLGFGFRIYVLKSTPVGGVLFFGPKV